MLISTMASSTSKPKESVVQQVIVREDMYSIKGCFKWESIGIHVIPYIIRINNETKTKYVAVRFAEFQVLKKMLNFFHPEVYSCVPVQSYFITEPEAKLLNDINSNHCDSLYGSDKFCAKKDFIVRLEDLMEFNKFLDICYKKLVCKPVIDANSICGFIRINDSVVPYCLYDNQRCIPLFYFEGETQNLRNRSFSINGWILSYLKFCCKIQGIRNELIDGDSCTMAYLDVVKNNFPPWTYYEEYWPTKLPDPKSILLNNNNTSIRNPSGLWTRPPFGTIRPVHFSQNVSTPAIAVPSFNQAVNHSTHQWHSAEIVNNNEAQRRQSTSHLYQTAVSSTPNISNQNYTVAGVRWHEQSTSTNIPLLPLSNAGTSSTPDIHMSYYNLATPLDSQIFDLSYGFPRMSNEVLQLNQPQQIIAFPYVQEVYGTIISNASGITGRLDSARNSAANIQPCAIVDLSSPPSSPTPQNSQFMSSTSHGLNNAVPPNRPWLQEVHRTSRNPPYKIIKSVLKGKTVNCINRTEYVYSELMLPLEEIVKTFSPRSSADRCEYILQEYFHLPLIRGNHEQVHILRIHFGYTHSSNTLLVERQNITVALLEQLQRFLITKDELARILNLDSMGRTNRRKTRRLLAQELARHRPGCPVVRAAMEGSSRSMIHHDAATEGSD